MPKQAVVVFAKDKKRVSAFYQRTLALDVHESDASHDLLRGHGCEVVVHAIPPQYAADIAIATPPAPRDDTPIKPTFVVASLADVRRAAESTGGFLKPDAGAWQIRGHTVIDGWDPEGNIVQFKQMTDATQAAAAAPPDENFFRALEAERTRALVARDVAAIRRLHAPDYELISVPGRVMSLDRYLALMAQDVFYAGWDLGPIRVRVGQDQAALRYAARITFPSGKVVDCWHTDIYALRSGRWQAVWSQATQRAPDAPPASGADAP